MENVNPLETGQALLAEWVSESKAPEPNRLDLYLDRRNLLSAVKRLNEERWGYLSCITGLDPGPATGELEALYHFCRDANVLTLRVRTPREGATLPSICGIIPYAVLVEREMAEMFGITILDRSDDEHLFLPEDWPAGVYPLRKDVHPEKLKDVSHAD